MEPQSPSFSAEEIRLFLPDRHPSRVNPTVRERTDNYGLIGILIPLGLSLNVSTGLLGVSCAANAIVDALDKRDRANGSHEHAVP